MSLAVTNARQVVAFDGDGPLTSADLERVEIGEGISITCEDEHVSHMGAPEAADVEFDARGCSAVPGFVDPHTHVPFFGWRGDEDAARLAGKSYEDLHRSEGGIFRSARLLAQAADAEVLDFSAELARSMLTSGTTSFETKSGYGLAVDDELRQLRLAVELAAESPQRVVHTCLAAHAVPKGWSAGDWVEEAAELLLPRAARHHLASACDLYVESIAFAPQHAARLASAAAPLGLRMRVHADQLSDTGMAERAAELGFASADHLNHTSPRGVAALADSDTTAVLLPGATFTLRQAQKPPARALLDAGAIVALGSDFNPGTSPLHSMPLVMALACRLYGLTPLEALAAATVNAAYVLGLEEGAGRVQVGGRADIVVLDLESYDLIGYRQDVDPVAAVIAGGRLVHVAPGARERVRRG